jgi:hypothetical protein
MKPITLRDNNKKDIQAAFEAGERHGQDIFVSTQNRKPKTALSFTQWYEKYKNCEL